MKKNFPAFLKFYVCVASLLLSLVFGNYAFAEEIKKVQVESLPSGIKIEWNHDPSAKRSVVVRSENGQPQNANDGVVVYSGTSDSFVDTDIQTGKTYYYSVISVRDKILVEEIKNIARKTLEIVENIPIPAKVGMVAVGIGTQTISLFTFFDSLKDLWLTVARVFQVAIASLLIRKKSKWGLVYDWNTKEPLKNISVYIANDKGEKLDGTLTDEAGRFGFLAKKGEYYVKVATNKKYASEPDKYQPTDIYGDVYKGQKIIIKEGESVILKLNIPLSSAAAKEVSQKTFLSVFSKLKSSRIFDVAIEISFWFGLVFMIYSVLQNFSWLSGSILLFYVFVIFVRLIMFFTTRGMGLVLDADKKTTVPFAVVRTFKERGEKGREQLGTAVTNTKGNFYLLAPEEANKISIKGRTLGGRNFGKEVAVKSAGEVMDGTYYV